LSHWGEVDPRRQLSELLRKSLAYDVSELGHECPEKLLLQLRGHQLQNPGIRSITSCLQSSDQQGVSVRRSESFHRRLECLHEGVGSDVGGGDCIADRNGEVIEVGTAGGQVFDGAGDGGHR
jgi:hypothetical protein